ncbi:phosphotransferase enzyme family protein [Aspergillus homomorphus CBS 101889]|uniref:Phosphotransferase enzyme family protein n=1 Tax=Aspergillus homomorphus (strain CBS 101889) TaxID=1450537 RepID=A0A395HU76_ASPHC|nr:phosphotransferase enzyme family protein [Aspergillus homomorphus CBS 101889]RAL11096.1 phosphotransferase enzyme family protein [Aspergillus homomorphus CBS 101889]
MDDGFDVIVKIPYHITGPKHYATASKAATLTYLNTKDIPVPKVYRYSSSDNNPAGVEYIVLEKAAGVGLETKWLTMSKRERHTLALSAVEVEKKFFDIPFRAIRSIYFKQDVPSGLQTTLYKPDVKSDRDSEIFCIGPTADYRFWYGKRAELDLHKLDFPHNGVCPGEKSPADYLSLLEKYLALPTLRHPDLNPNNIFISPDTGAVTCIIDWQYTTIEPRLLAAGYPRAFENPDPEQSPTLEGPSLPLDNEALSPEEKAEAEEPYRRRLLFYYYRIFNGHSNKPHIEALRDPILLPRQHLVGRAGRQWNGNLIILKEALLRMTEYWPHLPDTKGVSCPVHFTDTEVAEFGEQEQLWFQLNSPVNHWRDQVGGVSEDGWISNDRYDDTVRKIAELKSSLLATAEGDEEDIRFLEKGWLFRDRPEIY